MKKIEINILEQYRAFRKNTNYVLEGDLIILSGINGSGKSQLLNIIANNHKEKINRIISHIKNEEKSKVEKILSFSFRDNIDLGDDFGAFSVTYKKNNVDQAWNFYDKNIKIQHDRNHFFDMQKIQNFENGTLLFESNGGKKTSWRSILKLTELINENYTSDKRFNLTRAELEAILPADFIWRNENDIIQQTGNLFYLACCDRVNQQIKYSSTNEIFNNEDWLKTAPWTVLNELFEQLDFKYRFKEDYKFITPNMEENPRLREGEEIRKLIDLSDGEKAILKLALISLDEELSQDIKLILFDEYDAPLNPSLTEAFFHVIEKFYVEKDIQVIITTHSPATISLAPEYTQFYEIFSQENKSPKIVKANKYDYEELKKANKTFYDKIKSQEMRIEELEHVNRLSGNVLLVEDQYDQIYKIAYLKVKGVEEISESNLEELFEKNAEFSIHGKYSTGGLYNVLNCSNISKDQNCKTICLFDFDAEGYEKFNKVLKLKNNDASKIYSSKKGEIGSGLYTKHNEIERYALMIPIPERLEKYVSTKTSSDCFIEIETLISEEYLQTNENAEKRSEALPFYKMKDKCKNKFWKDLLTADGKHFKDFVPLFEQIEKIFDSQVSM